MPTMELSPTLTITLAGFLVTVIGFVAAGHALIRKRRPQSAFGWIAVCLTLPVIGPLLYFLFGINRVRTRARLLRRKSAVKGIPRPIGELPLEQGNCVEALHNGEQAYPAMLDAIMQAENRVYLSSYIFDSSDIGRAFVTALSDASARGAEVRVLLDGIGELYSRPRASALLHSVDVRFGRFLPPHAIPPSISVNLRNHRKILIADGIAFAGGMNIAKRHLVEDPDNRNPVVDLHFQLMGPVVDRLAEVFVGDWAFATGEALSAVSPAPTAAGDAECRVVADGPDDDSDPLPTLLLQALGGAAKRIAIMTPYFIPPRMLMGALQSAALRGIDVAVVLPAKSNLPYVHWATQNLIWELLQRNVRIYHQPPPFVHSKLLLIDDAQAVVGSWNIDPRSLRLNYELAVEIRDRRLVEQLGSHFEDVRARSTEVTLEQVDSRRLPTRLRDGAAWLFSPYL
jgi:cardiolipin synthase A/B